MTLHFRVAKAKERTNNFKFTPHKIENKLVGDFFLHSQKTGVSPRAPNPPA